MPREVFKSAATPKRYLEWAVRKVLQNMAHEAPSFQICQSQSGRTFPRSSSRKWIDTRDVARRKQRSTRAAPASSAWPRCRRQKLQRRGRQRVFPQADGSLCHRPNGHNVLAVDRRQETEEAATLRCHQSQSRGRFFAYGLCSIWSEWRR